MNYNNSTIIFVGLSDGSIFGIDLFGNIVYEYNLDGGIVGSIMFSDFDNDFIPDLIASTDIGKIYLLNIYGVIFQNFPIIFEFPNSSSPLVFDLDQDLDLEIIGGTSNSVYAIDYKSTGRSDNYWNLFKGNNARNGYYYSTCNYGDLDQNNVINILDAISLVNIIIGNNFFLIPCKIQNALSNLCATTIKKIGNSFFPRIKGEAFNNFKSKQLFHFIVG